MNKIPESIAKQPELKTAEDFYQLRREGIGFIEKMASKLWTDYNAHDPGITILEVLCYAMTDLAYRANWDIKDLLTLDTPTDINQPFPKQAFFTAREILTVNPVTPDDFRRLLIDLAGIRNAWVLCSNCVCDFGYYAEYKNGQFQLSYQRPRQSDAIRLQKAEKVELNGLYEVLLELEADAELGDLNDHKIEHTYTIFDADNNPHSVILEMRFSDNGLAHHALFNNNETTVELISVEMATSTAFKALTVSDLRNHWRNVFFVRFTIKIKEETLIEQAALRIFGDVTAKNDTAVLDKMKTAMLDAGFIQRYRNKLSKKNALVKTAKDKLHEHRNLDEEFCHVNIVSIEDIAVCADIEVAPDADIERIQARIWFEIENYFNPPVRFYSLQELLDSDTPVETIFNGPMLSCGFIKDEELQAAELKTILRTSDIINRLVDIDGVVAVNNLLLSKYDTEGRLLRGQADPTSTGFDRNKLSAAWVLYVQENHQPRLYHNLSRFLFFKNGLPFMPRMDEARQTLTQLRGEAERPKIKNALIDLPIPSGIFRNPEDYYPLQYSFPLTYGIGAEGLPSGASPERKAQAKQLKAYLMVFEQLLVNALAQLAHAEQLFSLDYSIERTYFVKELNKKLIQGYDDLLKTGFDKNDLESITETTPEFHERRNRFLNHLMARFGEQFGEYALLLTNFLGQQVAFDRLIEDKISFLRDYPLISRDRSRAFNYKKNPCAADNFSGLKKRVSLLLGYPDLVFSEFIPAATYAQNKVKFPLIDSNGKVWLAAVNHTAQNFQDVIVQMIQLETYSIDEETKQFRLQLKDKKANVLAQHPELFSSKAEAETFRDELIGWSANKRAIIVEHLLLRPKFPGDALYPVNQDNCNVCADADPYSFRLTFVMPGWTAPYNINMEMRHFADRTIRQEAPAHLLAKICWIDNTGFEFNSCDPLIATLAELLEKDLDTNYINDQAYQCATTIFKKYHDIFKPWFNKCKTQPRLKKTWEAKVNQLFKKINKTDFSCADVVSNESWEKIQAALLTYFTDITLYGWQFERFEEAWFQWLDVNAQIDWAEIRLQERLQAILKAGFNPVPDEKDLCAYASNIISDYAELFYHWIQDKIANEITLDKIHIEELLVKIPSYSDLPLSPNAKNDITALLIGKTVDDKFVSGLYGDWIEVSYRLRIVINLLSELRNTYPNATLHDCDDGSDQNPVRLGSTALGSYPLRSSI